MSTDDPRRLPDGDPHSASDPSWAVPGGTDRLPTSSDDTPTAPEGLPGVPPLADGSPILGDPRGAHPQGADQPPPTTSRPASRPAASADARAPVAGGHDGDARAVDAPAVGGPVSRRSNPVGLVALIVAVVALVMAVLPVASFFAGLPALAAIVLGIVGLVLTGRRRGFAIAGLVLGAVALIVAIVVSTIAFAGAVRDRLGEFPQFSDFPSDLPTDGSSAGPALASGEHTVVYRVSGKGTATITYSTIANGRSASARDEQVALPHSRRQQLTVTGGGRQQFLIAAIALRGEARLTCSIEVDGKQVATNESASSSGVELVTCDAIEGQD